MRRLMLLLVPVLVGWLGMASPARALTEEAQSAQDVVDRATVTVERMKLDQNFREIWAPKLERAKAVFIVPSLVKAGFILGGQYGSGVLLVRSRNNVFSDPAFYKMVAGSIGLQIGVQDAEAIFLIMTDKGLDSIMNNHFKASADMSIAVVRGAGMGAGTTSNVGADIYAFSLTVGLFGGGSFEGAMIEPRNDWNNHYYNDLSAVPQTIVIERRFMSPNASKLHEALER
ncbi:MAG: lipid-binding SYLF domain-containing protein [Alphaproteobacteria bacterium]|nr:lipid-binding SYLF domain-containing protein [Alphaproteobacteria bacterium]